MNNIKDSNFEISQFEKTISLIISVDSDSKKRMDKAREKQKNINGEVQKRLSEYKAAQMLKAEKKIADSCECIKKDYSLKIDEIRSKNKQYSVDFENKVSQNRELWKKQIFSRIVER